MPTMRSPAKLVSGLCIAIGLLAASPSRAQTPDSVSAAKALSSTLWLTTKVYLEGAPEHDVQADYMGVVGLSRWDSARSRYEFFDPATGVSRLKAGGGGYFFITGDGKHHVLVPDAGAVRVLPRRLEKLTTAEFTYSREVPRKMVQGNPPVRIYVVHTPYTGPFNPPLSQP